MACMLTPKDRFQLAGSVTHTFTLAEQGPTRLYPDVALYFDRDIPNDDLGPLATAQTAID